MHTKHYSSRIQFTIPSIICSFNVISPLRIGQRKYICRCFITSKSPCALYISKFESTTLKRIFLPKTYICNASSDKRYSFPRNSNTKIFLILFSFQLRLFQYIAGFVFSILVSKLILKTDYVFSQTKFMKSITTRLKECLNIIYPHLLSPPFQS